jgi:hypothetical protein
MFNVLNDTIRLLEGAEMTTPDYPRALSTIDALEISARIYVTNPDLGQALHDEVSVVEEGLVDELPVVEGQPHLYLITRGELHAILSRGVMAGAGVVVQEVGLRLQRTGDVPEVPATGAAS